MTFDASGANDIALHSFVIVLSMTATVHGGEVPARPVGLVLVPKPLVQVGAVSALVDRPTAQSTSWSIVTLKWWTKPPVETPIELPHEVCVAAALGGRPEFSGPCHSDAELGEPGLFHAPHVIEFDPSVARAWPFDDVWPSNAAETKMCA